MLPTALKLKRRVVEEVKPGDSQCNVDGSKFIQDFIPVTLSISAEPKIFDQHLWFVFWVKTSPSIDPIFFYIWRESAMRLHLRDSSTFELSEYFIRVRDFPELPADMQVGSRAGFKLIDRRTHLSKKCIFPPCSSSYFRLLLLLRPLVYLLPSSSPSPLSFSSTSKHGIGCL